MADSHLLRPLLEGAVLQKYDYGRSRRSPKFVMLSADLRRLRWRPASATELPVAPRPPPLRARAAASTTSTRWRPSINAATQARGSGGGIRRSLSFGAQRWSSAELSAVSDVRYGGTLARTDDPRWLCVSLLMDARTFDFALASESQAAAWVLGLQRAVALARQARRLPYAGPLWSVGQLCWQRARLKLRHEANRTGLTPADALLNAVLFAMEAELERAFAATRIQAAWRGRAARRRYRQLVAAMNALLTMLRTPMPPRTPVPPAKPRPPPAAAVATAGHARRRRFVEALEAGDDAVRDEDAGFDGRV